MNWVTLYALLKKKITEAIGLTNQFVDELPSTGENGVLYFVDKGDPQDPDQYFMYVWDPDNSEFVFLDPDMDLSIYAKTADLANVATSGDYADLTNKPTIPAQLKQLTDDSTHRLVTDTEKATWNNSSWPVVGNKDNGKAMIVKNGAWDKGLVPSYDDISFSGNPISIDNANGLKAKSAKVTMLPIQSGSGDPSPTNIRSISGRNSVGLIDSGKNMLDIQHTTLKKWAVVNQLFATVRDSSTRIVCDVKPDDTLEIVVNNAYSGLGFMIEKSSETRRFSLISERSPYAIYLYTGYEDGATAITRSGVGEKELTIPPNTSGFLAFLYVSTFTATDNKLQLELGSTSTEYKPYQGETYTATFPSTVYGGEYEFVGGSTESDLVYLTFDSCFLLGNWGSYNKPLYYINVSLSDDIKEMHNATMSGSIYCNYFKKITTASEFDMENFEIRTKAKTVDRLYFRADDYTLAELNDLFAETPLQVAITKNTPTETTLTPQSISLNKGDNVITTDGDNAELVCSSLELPAVSSADAGKVAMVDSNGNWVAGNIPDGSNTSY